MKPRIKLSENNIALLAFMKANQKTSKWHTITLPLLFNMVAGLAVAALFIWLSMNTERELRSIELQNTKSTLLWSERIDATKENMKVLASLHNFIKYEMKSSMLKEIRDGQVFDSLDKHSVQPLMFKDYMEKHRSVMEVIKSNSPMLSDDMAKSTEEFLDSMEGLVALTILVHFDPNKLFPIEVGKDEPKHPDTAYQMATDMVEQFETQFLVHFKQLEQSYRKSMLVQLK